MAQTVHKQTMEKRKYTQPYITVWNMTGEQLLQSSAVTSDLGISFGGIDESGLKDPLSRQLPDFSFDVQP